MKEHMIQKTPHTDRFKEQMQGSLLNETKDCSPIKVGKQNHVYTVGDERETVYFIEKGQIKLVMVSEEGKECMLAIHGAGDVFGELCLSGLGSRRETATAMEDTFLKEIPCGKFLERLAKDSLLEGFIRYLTVRVADQQQVIANLVTVDSEQRLWKTLLQIARKLGKKVHNCVLWVSVCGRRGSARLSARRVPTRPVHPQATGGDVGFAAESRAYHKGDSHRRCAHVASVRRVAVAGDG